MSAQAGGPTLDLPALAAVGPYFALSPGPAERGRLGEGVADAEAGWRPVAELIGSPEALRARVVWAAERLGTADRVVAASLFYQGWAARFTSVFTGSVVLSGVAPDLAAPGLSYRYPSAGGPIDLAVGHPRLVEPDVAWRRLVDGNLAPLGEALRAEVRVGRRLLWGNVASSLAGSLHMLDRAGHGPLRRLVAEPWARPRELAGLGNWIDEGGGTGPNGCGGSAGSDRLTFRRTTCCLYERLPGAGRCGDCSLGPA